MDPLSIIASTVAILQAGGAAGEGLRKLTSLKDAPAILIQLNSDATDLVLVIRAVADLPSAILEKETIGTALQRAKSFVLELEECIAYCLTSASSTSSVIKIRRRKWFFIAENKIRELRSSLRDAKLDLITATGVVNVASVYTVAVHVESISLRTSQIKSQLQQLALYSEKARSKNLSNYEPLETSSKAVQTRSNVRGETRQLFPTLKDKHDRRDLSELDAASTTTSNRSDDLFVSGADRFHEDNDGVSSYSQFWDDRLWQRDSNIYGSFNPELLEYTDLQMALLGLGMDSLHGSISATPRASVEERNSVGRTALSFAAALNNIDAVEHLLRKGADPNSEDNQNQTPLYYTISYGDSKSAQLLLDAGAVPQNDSNQLFSLLAEAVRRLPLWSLVGHKYPDEKETRATEILTWLLERGADINAEDSHGQTATFYAIQGRSHRMHAALLQKGADITKSDIDGWTLLHYTTMYADINTLCIMQAAGLQSIKLQARDRLNRTAFMYANWRRFYNEEWSHWANKRMDADPEEWYDAFVALYLSILALQWSATVEMLDKELRALEVKFGGDWDRWIDDYSDWLDNIPESGDTANIIDKMPGAFPED
ncbi:hypothetical protein MMC34_003644 [Xylographa carneopallida]|nr:hypothetical protein [Xylographa carneopallida]